MYNACTRTCTLQSSTKNITHRHTVQELTTEEYWINRKTTTYSTVGRFPMHHLTRSVSLCMYFHYNKQSHVNRPTCDDEAIGGKDVSNSAVVSQQALLNFNDIIFKITITYPPAPFFRQKSNISPYFSYYFKRK